MAILQSTLKKFLKLYSKYGFSGEEFLPPDLKSENYDRIQLIYKANQDYKFSYILIPIANSYGVVGKIYFSPHKSYPYDNQKIDKNSEEELLAYALEKCESWLNTLREEIEAEEENKFIINPYFQTIPEEEMDKPFTPFQKELYTKGINNFIFRIENSNVRAPIKIKLVQIANDSKEELNSIQTTEDIGTTVEKPSKRSWLKKFVARIGIFFITSAVGGVVGNRVDDALFPEEKAQVYHITVQSFHFNYNNVFNYQENIYLPPLKPPLIPPAKNDGDEKRFGI